MDGEVYSSPNASTLPPIPRYSDSFAEYTTPRDTQQLEWSFNGHPQLAFVPLRDRFEGPIFQRLAYTFQSLPIEQDRCTLWCLSPTVKNQWEDLEEKLLSIATFLIRRSFATLPVDFIVFRLPSQYGWHRSVREEQYARKIAMRCRDAFIPLISLCSFAISLHLTIQDTRFHIAQSWDTLLVEQLGVHPEWVNSLQQSIVADFSPNIRVGVIVHTPTCLWLDRIPGMLLANVPIWFYWGPFGAIPPPVKPVSGVITLYRPTSEEIDEEHQRTCNFHLEGHLAELAQSEPPREEIPKPERYSRQKLGETWQEFFARHEVIRTRKIVTESEGERQRRLDRERNAQSHQAPSRNTRGPVVYYWSQEGQFRIRTRVFRGNVEDIWDHYADSQRRFNSIHNEWDICTEFDPEAHPEMDGDLLEFNTFEDNDLAQPSRAETPPGPPPYQSRLPSPSPLSPVIPPTHWADDLRNMYDSVCSAGINLNTPTLDHILCHRYGFDYTRISYNGVQPDQKRWDDV